MTRWMLALAASVAVVACDRPPSADRSSADTQEAQTATSLTVESASGARPDSAATAGLEKPAAKPEEEPRFRDVTLASGTALRLELTSAVASDTSHVEDPVRATLRQPIVVDGRTVLPAGAEVTGVITGAERSGRVKGRARVAYRFDTVRVDGERYDIRTSPISHVAPATKRADATKIAIGAGAGAALGAILGGGDGAAKGAAIGGAGGTGVVLATRGREVRLGPGADVTTRLTTPATIRVRVDE